MRGEANTRGTRFPMNPPSHPGEPGRANGPAAGQAGPSQSAAAGLQTSAEAVEPRDPANSRGDAMPLLEVLQLRKSFRGPDGLLRRIVDIPAFALERRAQVALSGESGCGKTTFLNLIAGILVPDQGCIRLAGQDMSALRDSARDRLRATTIGYIFQTFNLLQGYTCLENVLLGMSFGRGIDRALATALLRRVGLAEHLHHYPRQLSSGQQQRVAMARALANRPQLVLADEPTGHLDARNAGEALELIRQACAENQAALLCVSHDREVLDRFEDVRPMATVNRALAGLPQSGSTSADRPGERPPNP
jgi:putative ABC transport system ATP-binding protein